MTEMRLQNIIGRLKELEDASRGGAVELAELAEDTIILIRLQAREAMVLKEQREEVLNGLLKQMPEKWRNFWCGADACACLGCANGSGKLRALGFSKEEYEAAKLDLVEAG